MLKKTPDFTQWLLLLIMIFYFVSSCNKKTDNAPYPSENEWVESFLHQQKQLLMEDAEGVKQAILKLQPDLKDSVNHYRLTNFYAKALFYQYKLDSAINMDRAVVDFVLRQKQSERTLELLAYAYNDIGVFYTDQAMRDSAIHYLHKAAELSHKSERLIDIYINLADNYKQNTQFTWAADYYRKAMLIADSLSLNKKYAAPILTGLGTVYNDLNNFELADFYFSKVENYLDSLPVNEQLYFLNARGNYYFFSEDYDNALKYFYKLLNTAEKYEHLFNQTVAAINLGETFLALNILDSAEFHLDLASDFLIKMGDFPDVRYYLNGLYASLYLEMNKMDKAEYYLKMPFDSSIISNQYINQNYQRLEKLYAQKGVYDRAYRYARKVREYDEANRNLRLQRNIEEINFRYSQDTILLNKDLMIQKQEQQVAKSRNQIMLLTSLFIALLSGVFILSIFFKRRREKQYAKQLDLITTLRMENIRNRMSPHFIFNALNSLMPNLREHAELSYPIDNLIRAIRQSLKVSNELTVTLEDELKQVNAYLELLKSLKYPLPQVQIDIDDAVNLSASIPAMCIQIPFENAIKYAFDGQIDETSIIDIKVKLLNHCLNISIEDNGVGFIDRSEQDYAQSTKSGHRILHKTIELLNQNNTEKIVYAIIDKIKQDASIHGVLVEIQIPDNFNFNS